MQFKRKKVNLTIGDLVMVVDENLRGTVTRLEEEKVFFECEDGFEYCYQRSQLLKPVDDGIEFELSAHKAYDSFVSTEPNTFELPIQHHKNKWLIDLHIETLAPKRNFVLQHEALLFQLEVIKKCIEAAIHKRQRKIIFVHGVGKGRLRHEMRYFIDHHYSGVEYFDGDYRDFGFGATELIIHDFNQDDFS